MRILFLIARQFNQLLQMKELKNQGYDQNSIASHMKIQPFIVKNSWRQMESFTYEELERAVRECVEAEEADQNRLHERPDERGNADCDVYDVDIRPIQCYYGKQKLTELFGKDVRENEAVSGCDHDRAGGPVSFWNGQHFEVYERFGAHLTEKDGMEGVCFSVWAPAAKSVSVVGTFNGWREAAGCMERLGASGIYELFVPGAIEGDLYKYCIHTRTGEVLYKADPYAFESEVRPGNASEWPALRITAGGIRNG